MEKQKKIAIILDEMSIGGIPKASITFMNQLLEYYDVTIILSNNQGELTNCIPEKVHIKIKPYNGSLFLFKRFLEHRQFLKLLKTGIYYFIYAYITKRWVKSVALISSKKGIDDQEEFDCAIAYHGMNVAQLTRTLFEVNAKKKIAWIHGDHPFTKKHKKDVAKIYTMFDAIFCVSKTTKEKFIKDFPNVSHITNVLYNSFDVNAIASKAQEPIDMISDANITKLVTVGRISQEKGQEMIPKILDKLLSKGYSICWYVVGDGNDRKRIEEMVEKKNLLDYIYFVGEQDNPYPYILHADIYVQPSYTEGYGLTILEAAILGKAIVATNVVGAKEHLCQNKEVVLVKSDPEALASGIEKLLINPEFKSKMEMALRQRDFSNKEEINKLRALV